ncbi:uncharacterized protein JN550_003189 [Neoarthrinium moseri]|uniref:uncharacterized protein n=1 Tax=Neoarthrinium moseri TaxID=1658444 RepID=UPI001FDBB644|nr:uncharacterized protein JN550_003189 [Neoarthrinium moseri]KAI1873920.1 hypothetical protein JN550_003189 [Neoarthrinium moseri]
MQPSARIALRLASRRPLLSSSTAVLPRQIHSTPTTPATVSPIHGSGPPPEPPVPAADSVSQRLARRKKQAALLSAAQEIRASTRNKSGQSQPLRKRFWKDVCVREVDGAWEVHLDARPLRHPTTKEIVRLPLSKPMLASAIALEWDMLISAQQATKSHLIPLTSLVCRAIDIAEEDAAPPKNDSSVGETIRAGITRTVMRYLETDSLLCWAPPPGKHDFVEGQETLREKQMRAAEDIVGFLRSRVWPGVEIEPVLDGESIMPKKQSEVTRQIVQGWVMGLSSWELAGLERGVLAGKGLLGAVRLVVEWSEGPVGAGVGDGASGAERKFGVEEAAKAASLEVDWQIGNWGEVEDTHDVEKEDLRRQLGSVVLLVTGTGKA